MKKLYLKLTLLLVFIFSALCVQAQTGSVSGVVLDETNQPLPGATVSVGDKAAMTTVEGKYSITGLPNGNAVLTIRFVGYQTVQQTITVNGETRFNTTLKPSATGLNEVVVIGYGSQQKKNLTGAISTVTSKDFQKGSITTPEQLIAGKVPGISITSNGGAPGAGSTIRVRGGASLTASNDPLIVVDNVPLSNNAISGASNPLSLINPNDIETFTVLKDASATAIYGSRASNGVILITTKKGTSGAAKINFSTQVSAYKVGRQVDVLSAAQFREYVNANGTPAQIAQLGTANTNWQDEIYQTSLGTDNNLSISGTYKSIPYRVSGGYLKQVGVLVTDKLQRTTGGITLNPRLLDNHLKIDVNIKGALTNSRFANQGAIGAAVSFDPTQPVYVKNNFGNYFEWTDINGEVPNPNATRNPIALLAQRNDNSEVKRSYGNAQFDYSMHFLPELHANLNLGYDVSNGKGTTFVPANAAQNFAVGGLNNRYQQNVNNKVAEFYLNYITDLKSINSNINVTAGYGYYDFLTKIFYYPSRNANGDVVAGSEPAFPFDKPQNTLISYYGRAIYTLADKYILAASIRTDGSSRFAPENRWGVFPSAAFTWRVSQENFLKESNTLSDLKLRLSYGITGQQEGIPYYSYLPTYSLSVAAAKYQLGDTFYGMYAPAAYDKSIKWEQTATYNAGIDFGFLGNRITGSVDVYFKRTKDLLSNIPIPLGSNFSNTITTNVGNIENKGIEFALNGTIIRKPDFTWEAGFNATYNNNKITNLTAVNNPTFPGNATGNISGGTGNTVQIQSVGYNTFSYYLYKQVYDAAGKPLEGIYQDLNGDNIINEKDLYRFKSSVPKYILGFSTQATYKKWSVSTVLRANLGNYVYNNVKANIGVTRSILNPAGYLGNASTEIFRSGFDNNQYLSDYYVENASFLRMDNLGLSYNAGKIFGPKNNIGLRLNANCQNVFVITNYSGLDPEISTGIDNNFYPRPRTFVLGVNLDF
ncbi:SusC/RagA family TonB-linked outer membrane protein [Mucilaginibacter phyllosphaerae]|uniref:Iron complex outermembrane receptor protein n=1 Tax=Mucilaginibacter phyllosphaerae TaxID=1812349 RepID=A0A4Y8ABV4_9SPHI|nr:TonB-dependent receptor [Mucilaginibacter phyllosphaerae]MBB3969186.1 iron complex outermembrane receptor protein [Mucilaginibacter phyllosphaerae]TEW66007.1 TonB-dependent receptor [Mucilaginibacter phyllosphaerae]GGH06867.1 SusC/RagA family TonB-linked outer membrane protein [Mucilaginibacter phyllosphaerae]